MWHILCLSCSQCGLCDTYYIAHVKNACAFLGDGMSRIEVSLWCVIVKISQVTRLVLNERERYWEMLRFLLVFWIYTSKIIDLSLFFLSRRNGSYQIKRMFHINLKRHAHIVYSYSAPNTLIIQKVDVSSEKIPLALVQKEETIHNRTNYSIRDCYFLLKLPFI